MRKKSTLALLSAITMVIASLPAFAANTPKVDTGDTAWMLVSTALVMLMTPGLALFYGGLVRTKNVLSIFMYCFVALGVSTLQWILLGFTTAFGPSHGGVIGGLDYAFLRNVGQLPSGTYATTVPFIVFMAFQMMFAVITPALIAGAIAERMKFSAFVLFTFLWNTLVYAPLAHWVWNADGWLYKLGALDFAGGTVVHISSGISALVAALVIGKRKGYGKEPFFPNNLTMCLTGAALLWFGWFGFNGGSAVASNGLAGTAFVVTHIASALAMLSWIVCEWIHRSKPSALGAASGLVAGLVAITPASGFVTPMGAVVIGLLAGIVCYTSVSVVKTKLGYDDALDAFGVHGVGGTLGAILTGCFATSAVNAAVTHQGLFIGGGIKLVLIQLAAVIVTMLYAIIMTLIILGICKITTGLRVADSDEREGLDITQHGEVGYHMLHEN